MFGYRLVYFATRGPFENASTQRYDRLNRAAGQWTEPAGWLIHPSITWVDTPLPTGRLTMVMANPH